MSIEIKAVIYVPGRILIGVCFPKAECKEFPHMTLLLGANSGYNAKHSNDVLQATCKEEFRFKTCYEQASRPKKYTQEVMECSNVNIQLNRNKVDTVPTMYFISLGKERAI